MRPLVDLLIDRPHSLLRQSWAPLDMRAGGTINADGFGVGWYPTPGEAPLRYRRECPMWTDENFTELAGTLRAGALLAAVRSATVGMPVVPTAAAPFRFDRWLFSHNGRVTGWPDSVAPLAAELPAADLLRMDAPTDSALLSALLRNRLRAGASAEDAVVSVVTEVAALAPDSRLNLLLTDGETVVGTAWHHALSVLVDDSDGGDRDGGDRADGRSVVVASEPWDADPRWQPVPDRHLVLATRSGVRVRHLESEAVRP